MPGFGEQWVTLKGPCWYQVLSVLCCGRWVNMAGPCVGVDLGHKKVMYLVNYFSYILVVEWMYHLSVLFVVPTASYMVNKWY